jgi:2-polyprenyl-3-methyl-5-hydroxy-6-metoxy-1,4-benzoquinol methylase
MAFLTQSRFPRLWLLMQNMIGGNACKQAMATEHYRGQKRVLEVGCSVGNISEAFRAFPNVAFTGIDIDRHAIDLAKRRFRKNTNFRFSLSALKELSCQGEAFDYVLFAGILHHVDDNTGLQLLRDAVKCLAREGRLVIYEPEAPRPSDGWVLRYFCAYFEQGVFLRTRDALRCLVERAGITLESIEDRMVSPGIVAQPYVARFNLLVGTSTEWPLMS